MFNDLNNPNTSEHAAVDDIFAETDKPNTGGGQSEIETHRVGLATSGESLPRMETSSMPSAPSKNYLKIIIIVLVSLAVLGGAYFVYSQFFSVNKTDVASTTSKVATTTASVTSNTTKPDNSFVSVIPGASSSVVIPEISSSTASATQDEIDSSLATNTVSTSTVISTIDSDKDGLTDVEEKAAGTNPNIIDTDNDGLSDYEEVKIYHTNPLVADTDGDGYLDGAEVKSGYNPNGPGKLPGNTATTSTPATK